MHGFSGADRGGDILYLRSSVARAPPRPLNGTTLSSPAPESLPRSSVNGARGVTLRAGGVADGAVSLRARLVWSRARAVSRRARLVWPRARAVLRHARLVSARARAVLRHARLVSARARAVSRRARLASPRARAVTSFARLFGRLPRGLASDLQFCTGKPRFSRTAARAAPVRSASPGSSAHF